MMIADEENDDSRIIVDIIYDNTREWENITEKRMNKNNGQYQTIFFIDSLPIR